MCALGDGYVRVGVLDRQTLQPSDHREALGVYAEGGATSGHCQPPRFDASQFDAPVRAMPLSRVTEIRL